MVNDEHLDVVVREFVEEVVEAGGCRYMRGADLEEFITNLVVRTFADEVQVLVRTRVRTCVEMHLLPLEARTEVAVDGDTVAKLRDALL